MAGKKTGEKTIAILSMLAPRCDSKEHHHALKSKEELIAAVFGAKHTESTIAMQAVSWALSTAHRWGWLHAESNGYGAEERYGVKPECYRSYRAYFHDLEVQQGGRTAWTLPDLPLPL